MKQITKKQEEDLNNIKKEISTQSIDQKENLLNEQKLIID